MDEDLKTSNQLADVLFKKYSVHNYSQEGSNFNFTYDITLADGTVQEVVVGSYTAIQSMGYNDIDNDGEDEYVFHIYFTNTLGEHEFLHVYKIADNKVEQFFPGNTGIAEVDEHAYWETETVVEVDGALKNAIKVES